jgi:hypothetical protein
MGILDWLFGSNDDATGSTVDPAIIEQRIEQVVSMVDPRLKLVSGYQSKLAKPVEQAILYCRELEGTIPSGLEMSAGAWSENPLLRALFATAQDVPAVFSRCAEVQDFFEGSPGAEDVWASLRFRLREEKGFGLAVHGEVVQHDVARTSVSFGEKKVLQPCACEHDARIEIRRRAFKFLVTQALEQVASVNTRRKDLIEQRSMLQARLSILKGQRAGLESMFDADGGAVEKIGEVERKLAENEHSLAEFPGAGETLDYVMKRVKSVLTHASDYLQVRPITVRLNQMNIIVPEGSGEAATELVLPEVLVKHVPQINLLVGRFPRSELIRRGSLIDEGRRLLG